MEGGGDIFSCFRPLNLAAVCGVQKKIEEMLNNHAQWRIKHNMDNMDLSVSPLPLRGYLSYKDTNGQGQDSLPSFSCKKEATELSVSFFFLVFSHTKQTATGTSTRFLSTMVAQIIVLPKTGSLLSSSERWVALRLVSLGFPFMDLFE